MKLHVVAYESGCSETFNFSGLLCLSIACEQKFNQSFQFTITTIITDTSGRRESLQIIGAKGYVCRLWLVEYCTIHFVSIHFRVPMFVAMISWVFAHCLILSLPESIMETCSVVLTFKSIYKNLWHDHSNETSLAVLLHGTICFFLYFTKWNLGYFFNFVVRDSWEFKS